jgi:hypothetical protein
MMGKLKPILITAVIAVAAVWAWNKFIAPKTGISA